MQFKLIITAVSFLFLAGALQSQVLVVPPGPGSLSMVNHLTQSNDYTVSVKKSSDASYTTCFVYKTDNYASNSLGGEKRKETAASFTNISFSGTSVDVKITTSFTANSVTIRPLNYNIVPSLNGNAITFTLQSPQKISVEVNNRLNPLFLFADTPDVPNTKATYYYGPGVHKIGMQKIINSNESVYIAGGAVIEGTFLIPDNATNIEVRGRGIISNGSLPTLEQHTNKNDSLAKYSTFTNTNTNKFTSSSYNKTKFEGFIITNSSAWNFGIPDFSHKCYSNSWRNIKIVAWSGCTDGIWFDGNHNVIDDCFIFNNDDIVTTHGSDSCTISNTVMWGGQWGGHLFFHDDWASSSGITYENINLLGIRAGSVIFVKSSSGSTNFVRDVIFKNLRIESHPYESSYWTNKFLMFDLKSNDIKNWRFENVTIDDKNADEGDIYGTVNGTIDGIYFCNLKMGGAYANSLAQANMDKNSYATNISFCSATGMDEVPAGQSIRLYPNPASDQVIIESIRQGSEVELFSASGRKVERFIADDVKPEINLSALAPGIYLIKITDKNGNIKTGELVRY